jgi:hypothetical protein
MIFIICITLYSYFFSFYLINQFHVCALPDLEVLPTKIYPGIYTSSSLLCMLQTDSQTKTVYKKKSHQ